MGWRFSRRIKVLPGVSVNRSKSGVWTSVGRRGGTITIGNRRRRMTLRIPGTGLSYSKTLPQSRFVADAPLARGKAPSRLYLLIVALLLSIAVFLGLPAFLGAP